MVLDGGSILIRFSAVPTSCEMVNGWRAIVSISANGRIRRRIMEEICWVGISDAEWLSRGERSAGRWLRMRSTAWPRSRSRAARARAKVVLPAPGEPKSSMIISEPRYAGLNLTRAFSVPIESERGSISCFDAFSLREPVSTSLENALASVGQTRQHHGCLEFVYARFRAAVSLERQWSWVQRQVSDVGRTTRRLECIRLASAKVNVVHLPDSAAHLSQPGVERRRQEPPRRPHAKRACRIGQPGARLPGMANRLRRLLENLEQPLDALKIPPGEAALEIAVVGEDQDRECRHMSGSQRGTVANRVAIRRLACNH